MTSLSLLGLLLSLLTVDKYGCAKGTTYKLTSELHFGSMKTFSKTNDAVYHLEEDVFASGNILYADGYTLMTTDGQTSHLIVGSDDGYSEGRSAQAMFGIITGFLQTNSSHVLVVDYRNECLRYVNRLTNFTTPFVGECTIQGFTDGQHTRARFFSPRSVIKYIASPETVIVTDRDNKALRSVELSRGDVKTLIHSLPGSPLGAALDSSKENLIIVFYTFLGKLNIKTLTFTLLTQAGNSGGLDGEFSTASFDSAREIIPLSDTFYLVGDVGSRKLRIVNLDKQRIDSICDGKLRSADGPTKTCSIKEAWGLLLKSGTLYIGELGAIRTISVRHVWPCKNMSFTLSAEEEDKCLEILPGNTICLPTGIHKYMIPKENCTITINITKEKELLPCRNITFRLPKDEHEKCIEIVAGHHLCFPVGIHTYRIPEKNCTFIVIITKEDLLPCQNMAATLPAGEQVKCLEVTPGHMICLPSGSHTYRIPEKNCSIVINITEEVRHVTCTKEIHRNGDPKTLKAELTLPDGTVITLPVGRYVSRKLLPNNTSCETVIHVSDPKLTTRLDVSADYQLPCSLFNDFKDLARSVAKSRYGQVKQLSNGSCNESADSDVMMSCNSDILHVIWPTDCLFDRNSIDGKGGPLTVILGNLQKVKGYFLELFIPSHMPPVIQPKLNQKGLPATVVLTPVCSGGLTYMNMTETCQ